MNYFEQYVKEAAAKACTIFKAGDEEFSPEATNFRERLDKEEKEQLSLERYFNCNDHDMFIITQLIVTRTHWNCKERTEFFLIIACGCVSMMREACLLKQTTSYTHSHMNMHT